MLPLKDRAPAWTDATIRERLGPYDLLWRPRPGLRDAAVLAPWFTRGGEDFLLFTERRADLPEHPGQVAFPGGAREGDEDPLGCALREFAEEVGLDRAAVAVLGRLPDRVSIAGYTVAAFVGRIPPPRDLRPDPREVAAVFEVPLAALRDPALWREEPLRTPSGRLEPSVPFFDWEGHVVWGLTGRLVLDLLERVR